MPTITARITSVQKDTSRTPPWFRIKTDHSEVKQLDTKDDDKAKEAWDLLQAGEPANIEFTSKPRTLEDGRTFQNYYYDRGSAARNGGTIEIPEVPTAQQTTRRTDPSDAWRITLAASSKLAVQSVPALEAKGYDMTIQRQQTLALEWANFLYFTPAPTASTPPPIENFAGFDPGSETPPPGDDDIPF